MKQRSKATEGRITIQSVADRAGVSIATVSRVLSGNVKVREDLAERVIAAAKELDYIPSAVAQRLARGRTSSVGVLVPDLADPYFPEVVKGIHNGAAASGYRLVIADSDNRPQDEAPLIRDLARQVDGLILVSPRADNADLKALEQLPIPVVLLNRMEPGIGLASVGVDNFAAMSELCGHIASLGHKRVSFLSGPTESWQQRERARAVLHAANFGLNVKEVPAGGSIHSGHESLDIALEHQPTAVICWNDLVALGVIARATELGIRIPEDLSVTGFNDIEFAQFSSPPLTTVRSPQVGLGEAGWAVMERMLAGETPDHPPLLEASLVLRASTRAPK